MSEMRQHAGAATDRPGLCPDGKEILSGEPSITSRSPAAQSTAVMWHGLSAGGQMAFLDSKEFTLA
jgi:hypothetical protein